MWTIVAMGEAVDIRSITEKVPDRFDVILPF